MHTALPACIGFHCPRLAFPCTDTARCRAGRCLACYLRRRLRRSTDTTRSFTASAGRRCAGGAGEPGRQRQRGKHGRVRQASTAGGAFCSLAGLVVSMYALSLLTNTTDFTLAGGTAPHREGRRRKRARESRHAAAAAVTHARMYSRHAADTVRHALIPLHGNEIDFIGYDTQSIVSNMPSPAHSTALFGLPTTPPAKALRLKRGSRSGSRPMRAAGLAALIGLPTRRGIAGGLLCCNVTRNGSDMG